MNKWKDEKVPDLDPGWMVTCSPFVYMAFFSPGTQVSYSSPVMHVLGQLEILNCRCKGVAKLFLQLKVDLKLLNMKKYIQGEHACCHLPFSSIQLIQKAYRSPSIYHHLWCCSCILKSLTTEQNCKCCSEQKLFRTKCHISVFLKSIFKQKIWHLFTFDRDESKILNAYGNINSTTSQHFPQHSVRAPTEWLTCSSRGRWRAQPVSTAGRRQRAVPFQTGKACFPH